MAGAGRKRRSKYGAKPTVVDGIRFHSKLEAARYRELRARQRAGAISNLERQCRYPIYWPGRARDRLALLFTYVCDFRYIDDTGRVVVEDVKGATTGAPMGVFRIKQKALKFDQGIHVHVVTRKRTTWFVDGKAELHRYEGATDD